MMKYGKTFGVEIEWQWIVFKYNENDLDHGQLLADQHNIQFNYYRLFLDFDALKFFFLR